MSVLIKCMKIPESCLDCPIYDNYYYRCNLYSYGIPARYNYSPSKRPEWCELEELPEHHGRLIDADYLKEHLYTCATNGRPLHRMCQDLNELLEVIDDIPTVVETE